MSPRNRARDRQKVRIVEKVNERTEGMRRVSVGRAGRGTDRLKKRLKGERWDRNTDGDACNTKRPDQPAERADATNNLTEQYRKRDVTNDNCAVGRTNDGQTKRMDGLPKYYNGRDTKSTWSDWISAFGRTERRTSGLKDGWMDVHLDGRTDGRTYIWMKGRMERRTDRSDGSMGCRSIG